MPPRTDWAYELAKNGRNGRTDGRPRIERDVQWASESLRHMTFLIGPGQIAYHPTKPPNN